MAKHSLNPIEARQANFGSFLRQFYQRRVGTHLASVGSVVSEDGQAGEHHPRGAAVEQGPPQRRAGLGPPRRLF